MVVVVVEVQVKVKAKVGVEVEVKVNVKVKVKEIGWHPKKCYFKFLLKLPFSNLLPRCM